MEQKHITNSASNLLPFQSDIYVFVSTIAVICALADHSLAIIGIKCLWNLYDRKRSAYADRLIAV